MNKVGIYLRVSTEEQARIADGSLVSQRRRLEEYVEGQNRRESGWGTIIDVYCDEAKSGKDMNRPEFQRLLGDLRSGRVNLILATELSRLSRSIKDFCGLWDLFKEHKAKFVTLRENFDTTSAAGEMMVFNLINFAQFERKQTAERISANWASRAKRGLWNGGSIPLGYGRNPANKGTLVPSLLEAEQVRTMFKLFLETGSLRQTCLKLSELGIRSKSYTNKSGAQKGGLHFTVSSLHHLLTNRTLVGMREVGKKAGVLELFPASWPAIVDTKVFETVQEILKANKNRYKPKEWKRYAYPLTERLVCGECGKLLGGQSAHGQKQTHFYYGHPRGLRADGINHVRRCRLERVRVTRIEPMILKFLKELLGQPGKIDEMVAAYQKGKTTEVPALEGRIKTLQSEIQASERRVENLVKRLADLPSDVAADPIYKQMKELNQKIAELKTAKTRLESQVTHVTAKAVDQNALKVKLNAAVHALETSSPEDQRPIFASVLKFAELHPTRIRMGIYAPTKKEHNPDSAKDGRSGSSEFSDFKEPFKATGTEPIPLNRARSSSVQSGALEETRTPTP